MGSGPPGRAVEGAHLDGLGQQRPGDLEHGHGRRHDRGRVGGVLGVRGHQQALLEAELPGVVLGRGEEEPGEGEQAGQGGGGPDDVGRLQGGVPADPALGRHVAEHGQGLLLQGGEEGRPRREVGVQRGGGVVRGLGQGRHGEALEAALVDQVGGPLQQGVTASRPLAGAPVGLDRR